MKRPSTPNQRSQEDLDRQFHEFVRLQAHKTGSAVDMGKVSVLLDEGANPGASISGSSSIMEQLMAGTQFQASSRSALLCLLIARGHNPLEWPKTFKRLPGVSWATTKDVLRGLRQMELSNEGMRTAQGGTALHCLIEDPSSWEDISYSLSELHSHCLGNRQRDPVLHVDWVKAKDNQGRTVVHGLIEAAQGIPMSHGSIQSRNIYLQGWQVLRIGGEEMFHVPDKSGVTAADMILDHLEKFPCLDQSLASVHEDFVEILNRWQAQRLSKRMRAGTPHPFMARNAKLGRL